MSFLELANQRYSFRGFTDQKVEQEKIDYILQCSQLAPSASNRQPWKIYVIHDAATREKLSQSYQRDWFAEAPVHVVFVGLTDTNWKRKDGADYLMCDVTIIADYFILAATEQGLGSVYIAAFDEQLVRDALSLPQNEKPFLLTPLGYTKKNVTRERRRKNLHEITAIL